MVSMCRSVSAGPSLIEGAAGEPKHVLAAMEQLCCVEGGRSAGVASVNIGFATMMALLRHVRAPDELVLGGST